MTHLALITFGMNVAYHLIFKEVKVPFYNVT